MKATILIDNITKNELKQEWGLSILIEHEGKAILLDTGKSGLFAENAKTLNIDLSKVDYGVLSHAHYDHADGMEAFFKINANADFYLQKEAKENCYHKLPICGWYIGIKKGTLTRYQNRIKYIDGDFTIAPGISIVSHRTPNLEVIGKKGKMYVKKGLFLKPDNFSHEHSLVIETDKGLIIFSSCSHAGADNIINEVKEAFPDKKIYAIIGGFHLFALPENQVRSFAQRVKKTGIEHIITGHCTGKRAAEILIEELGDRVEIMHSGMVIEI